MPIKWGSTTVTAVKWGNTNCMTVKWGNTIVFRINGYSNGTFSSPLTGWYQWNPPNWISLSSPSITLQTSTTGHYRTDICGTNPISSANIPKSTSSVTKYINIVFDWVLNNPTTATDYGGGFDFIVYFGATNNAPITYAYTASTGGGSEGNIRIASSPTTSTYGISLTAPIKKITPSADMRITFSVMPSSRYYTSSVNVTLTIKQVNFY